MILKWQVGTPARNSRKREFYPSNPLITQAAQDKKPISNFETALIEIVKYGSKIFTEPDLK